MAFPQLLQSLPALILRGGAHAPTTAIVFTILFLLGVLYILGGKRTKAGRLPPGPFAWPVIGSFHLLGTLPHRELQKLAGKYGPIMFLKLGSVPTVVVSSSAAAKEFLKTHGLVFASRPLTAAGKYIGYNYTDVVLAPYGPYWREMKKLCVVELLNPKRIESFRFVREEEVSVMIRSLWEKSEGGRVPVDVSKALSSLTSAIMFRVLSGANYFSDDHVEGKEVQQMMSEITTTAGAPNIGDFIPYLDWMDLQGITRRMKKAHKTFDEFVVKIINEHVEKQKQKQQQNQNQNQGAKDIIDVLLEMGTARQNTTDMKVTEENIKAIVFDMFVGGMETTSTTMEWAMSEIVRHPGVAKKLREEIESVVGERVVTERDVANMEYLQCVVKETLRLYPAGPLLIPHESTETCSVGKEGYLIPNKTRVIINAWAIARDGNVWEDPWEFRPERFMGKNIDVRGKDFFDMLPFGAGRRVCPGASLAVVTVELGLARMMQCFEWRIAGDASKLDMTEGFGVTMPRRHPLYATPALRMPNCL